MLLRSVSAWCCASLAVLTLGWGWFGWGSVTPVIPSRLFSLAPTGTAQWNDALPPHTDYLEVSFQLHSSSDFAGRQALGTLDVSGEQFVVTASSGEGFGIDVSVDPRPRMVHFPLGPSHDGTLQIMWNFLSHQRDVYWNGTNASTVSTGESPSAFEGLWQSSSSGVVLSINEFASSYAANEKCRSVALVIGLIFGLIAFALSRFFPAVPRPWRRSLAAVLVRLFDGVTAILRFLITRAWSARSAAGRWAYELMPIFVILTLSLQIILPIYCDEYAYQLIDARALFDHFTYSSFIPLCPDARNIPMPWGWYPAQFLWSLLFYDVESPRTFRLIGVLIYFGGLFGLSEIIWRSSNHAVNRRLIWASVAACFSVGTLPLISVFNRPEFVLVFCIGWFCFIPALLKREGFSPRFLGLGVLAHLLLVSLFFSIHPKSVLFSPLVILSTALIARRWGKPMTLVVVVLTSLLAFQSYRVYSRSAGCKESTAAAKINSSMYVLLDRQSPTHWQSTLSQLAGNLLNSRAYLKQNLFSTSYPIDWLPPHSSLTVPEKVFNGVAMTLIALLVFTVLGWIGWSTVGFLFPLNWEGLERVGLPMAAVLSFFGLDAVQSSKNFYEGELFIPTLGLLLIYSWIHLKDKLGMERAGRISATLLIMLSILSQSILWTSFAGPLWGGYFGRGQSVLHYDRTETKAKIDGILKLCGLSNDSRHAHVMLDDESYMYLKRTFEPINASYFAWAVSLDRGDDFLLTDHYFQEMKAIGVTGVVENCGYMDILPPLGRHSKRYGDICGIGEDDITALTNAAATPLSTN